MFDRATIRNKILPELRTTLAHQQRGRLRYRNEPTAVYRLLAALEEDGVKLESMRGPWGVTTVAFRRRGRGTPAIPCVERGQTRLFADTQARATALAGLLNWCEIEEGELAES